MNRTILEILERTAKKFPDKTIYEDINSKESDIRKQLYYNREKIYKEKLKKYKIDAIEIDGTLRNI